VRLLTVTSPEEAARVAGDVVEVYRAAFAAPPYSEGEEEVAAFAGRLPVDAARADFKLVLVLDAGDIAGFAYGYTGRRGGRLVDLVYERAPLDIARQWAGGHWELVDLAVHPDAQGRGLGGALHDALLDGLPHDRALLMTHREDSAGRRLYLRRGWQVLMDVLDREYSLLGLDLAARKRL
jgi:ribosomal protein S18 acetylase RimI-like enzyme